MARKRSEGPSDNAPRIDLPLMRAVVQTLSECHELSSHGAKAVLVKKLEEFKNNCSAHTMPPDLLNQKDFDVYSYIQDSNNDINPSSVYRIINECHNVSNFIAICMYCFVYNYHKSIFERNFEVIMREVKETFVEAVHSFLMNGKPGSAPDAAEFSGEYLFFQPYHRNPHEEVNVCHLKVGGENDDFRQGHSVRFRFLSREFNSLNPNEFTDFLASYEGRIVPHNTGGYIFLSGGIAGMVVIAIDHTHSQRMEGNHRELVHSFRGTMLAAVGHGHPSSAWPIYAVRMNENTLEKGPKILKRCVMDPRVHPLFRDVLSELDRGGVVWSHDLKRA